MADLSVAQRAALAQLIAACPDRLLSQLDGLAAAMTGDRAWALRDMVEAERLDRRRRDAAFAPLSPLFRPRDDGLDGLSFPATVPARLWRLATRNEPELLPQLDRDDELSRMVADRLCLSAASAVRDQTQAVWPGATTEQAAELAACFDLAGLARRCLDYLEAWMGRPGSAATAELKLALRQAASIAKDRGSEADMAVLGFGFRLHGAGVVPDGGGELRGVDDGLVNMLDDGDHGSRP